MDGDVRQMVEPATPFTRESSIGPFATPVQLLALSSRTARLSAAFNVLSYKFSILSDAPKKCRLHLVHSRQTEEIEAWNFRYPLPLNWYTTCVQYVAVNPAKIVTIPDCPYDSGNPTPMQINHLNFR